MAFAAPSSRPESSVPTPAEASVISRETPDLGAKENEDWKRLRDERRQARQQILSDLRNRSADEKQAIRQNVSVDREKSSRFEGEPSRNIQPRERDSYNEHHDEWQYNRGQGPAMPPPPMGPMGPLPPYDGWGHYRH